VSTNWRAGVARTVITPTESMWLAGWAVRTEPARGKLTDLYAKAVAVDDADGSRFVLLMLDLIAVSREMAAAIAGQVRQRFGLPRERLMICASHTHGGPEVRPDKVPFFHIPPEFAAKIGPYVEWLTARLVDVVGTALGDLRPATLTVCGATVPFAHNRREANAVDHDVPILDVTSDGRRRAVAFGYACHNTTMPPDDYRYCGDYAGYAQAALEKFAEVALFVAGAGADQDPSPRGNAQIAREHGEGLAAAVTARRRDPGVEITGRLRVAYDEVPLDFQPPPARERLEADRNSDDLPQRTKAEYLLDRLVRRESFASTYPCPLQVARLGDALLLVAIGGEPVVDYAREIKRRYAKPGRVVWVAGYANDMFGYVPSAAVLRGGGYEGTRSVLWSALPAPFAETTEERVLAGVDRLVTSVEQD
jgi:hypothetical protein